MLIFGGHWYLLYERIQVDLRSLVSSLPLKDVEGSDRATWTELHHSVNDFCLDGITITMVLEIMTGPST